MHIWCRRGRRPRPVGVAKGGQRSGAVTGGGSLRTAAAAGIPSLRARALPLETAEYCRTRDTVCCTPLALSFVVRYCGHTHSRLSVIALLCAAEISPLSTNDIPTAPIDSASKSVKLNNQNQPPLFPITPAEFFRDPEGIFLRWVAKQDARLRRDLYNMIVNTPPPPLDYSRGLVGDRPSTLEVSTPTTTEHP